MPVRHGEVREVGSTTGCGRVKEAEVGGVNAAETLDSESNVVYNRQHVHNGCRRGYTYQYRRGFNTLSLDAVYSDHGEVAPRLSNRCVGGKE